MLTMSSDLTMFTGNVFNSTAAASGPPADDLSYAEAFPPLPTTVSVGNGADAMLPASPTGSARNQWGKKMSVRSSTTTQVFSVPVEERRYKEMAEQQFGDRGREQAKTCADIMAKTGVSIEMSLAKDESLTVVVSGKTDAVLKARKLIVQNLQTQTHATVRIPKEHHRFVLGTKGKKLNELELVTATKINVPRPNDASDCITISGTREGIDRARHEIQLISDEQAKLAFERLPVPKVYHPFIAGPDNQTIRELSERTGVKIVVPPHSVDKDEIVVSGEKEGVLEAKRFILTVYEEKKRKSTTVSVEVKKSQHRYVIGQKGSGLTEILAATGVSVEIPPSDNVSETITLRGDPDKLGPALTMVYAKANSIESHVVEAPSWLHRFVIGRQGSNVRRITADFPRVHIEFTEEQDQIRLEGPPEDVEQAAKMLQDVVNDLTSRMTFEELNIDAKFHRHIVGRNGANINRLKSEHSVEIHIPSDTDMTAVRIEGSKDGVARAKAELMELVDKMENEKSRDIVIEQRLHRLIIGSQGSRIREIRDQFPHVSIFIPDYARKSDVITLRGPRHDVDRCYTYLQKLCHELVTQNVTAEVRVYRKYYRDVIAIVRKVRDETETRIDVPPEGADVTVITVSGPKDNVDKAKEMLESTQKALGRVTEQTIDIPHAVHASLQSAKGALIRAVRDECGGVMIRFPSATSNSDKVLLKGPEDDVELAKKLLLDLANDTTESRMTAEVRVNPAFHRFLIGRNGMNLKELSERTGARLVFPSQSDRDSDSIYIIGQQDAIASARAELEARIKDLENITEVEVSVEPRHHRHFVSRKADVVRQISDECGGVSILFPRVGVKSDKVVLKGARQCVDDARQRILDIVADLESHVTVECVIPNRHHRIVVGSKWCNIHDLTQRFNVAIKFPDRKPSDQSASQEGQDAENEMVNGDVATTTSDADRVRRQDIITISGKQEDCDAASTALRALVPVTEEVPVAVELHRFIIGSKGRGVRQMMDECDVSIQVPPADDNVAVLTVSGTPDNVARAKEMLLQRVQQLEEEKEQRVLRSFKLEVSVDPKFHPNIIGRRGTTVSKIRQDHEVQVTMPDKDSDRPDVIVITGLERNTLAARDDILRIVHDFEDLYRESVEIDHRVHSRIIGGRGRGVRRITEDYNVDLRFPGRDAGNPDLVVITGDENAVLECKDHLLQLEDEYLQDVIEREHYPSSSSRDHDSDRSVSGAGPAAGGSHPQSDGFFVRGAPWSNAAPDTNSRDDFPDLTQAAVSSSTSQGVGGAAVKWGPRR